MAERPFKSVRQRLTVEDGVVCLGDLVVPPAVLRPQILRAVHNDTHCGALATRHRLKREVWWPGHCEDVERFVRQCSKCVELHKPPARATHTWPEEEEAWQRVHIDHAHVPGIGLLLIVVDAFSGWPEAVQVSDKSAKTTIRILRSIFSRLGVPKTLVSDNAPEFCDGEMQAWLQRIGCSVMRTPPYHPQSNGCVERMVQTVKRGLRAFTAHRGNFEAYLAKLLLNYRATARRDGRGSPSELMGRQLRSPLTLAFEIDAPVIYQARSGAAAEPGHFVVQAGHNTAVITRDGERPVLAHRDQFRPLPAAAESDKATSQGSAVASERPEELLDAAGKPEEQRTAETDGGDGALCNTVPTPVVRCSQRSNKGIPPDRLTPRW